PFRFRSLSGFGVPDAEPELTRPADAAFVRRAPGGRRRTHPATGVVVLAAEPELPRLAARAAVVVDEQLGFRVDRVGPVPERELEELRLGDRLRRTRLDAQIAVDAAQVVDLVDEPVPLPW